MLRRKYLNYAEILDKTLCRRSFQHFKIYLFQYEASEQKVSNPKVIS